MTSGVDVESCFAGAAIPNAGVRFPTALIESDDFFPDAPITDADAISAADFRPCGKVLPTDDISFKRLAAPETGAFVFA